MPWTWAGSSPVWPSWPRGATTWRRSSSTRYRAGAPLAPGRTAAWLALDLAVGAVRSWYRARPDRAAMLLGLLDDALDPTR